ncbi:hypothetical protein RV11_GL000943 [Enterococcus phoeniculicola]|jgi:acyl-CoA reductase-like NAD-dependent aldehyde dehydrogenase|uniref:Aldehyde dehydrogenase domain-containing protein n=1 Tax=Enterococcus phoeniculicola ATCC BAA-412 TaxID=1158610 RepID=R3TKJ3_9ENTE|nr:aldehyde dehydrogenase family protein [Enterococcus phoeniculicola]EOL41568.1 hypothetical protein UC3_03131 [Enterococcus phoeniculicola ATCC BAA-412]EOT78938.1 hypothetical protein I589_00445 [Enterococcus phoeniculicola ATCC BAA-412]OJG70696.1 hypothetical protein RV11_GL000943 [Enterococcus phoeniculicola]
MHDVDKDLLSIQEARIVLETAKDAQILMKEYGQEFFHNLVRVMIREIQPLISEYVSCEIEETGKGCQKEKEAFVLQFLKAMEAEVGDKTYIGATAKDSAGKILQVGVPLGVIPVLLPSENVVIHTLYSLFAGLQSANAMIAIPHVKATKTATLVIKKIQQIGLCNGLPRGSINCIEYLTECGTKEIINSPMTAMILVLGQKKYTDTTIPKRPIIYGGSGATPVFIERSADTQVAVKMIIESRAYDCGLLPASEQYLIVESTIAEKVKNELIQNGAYFLSKEEEIKLISLLQPKNDGIQESCVGKSAAWLAKNAGIQLPRDTRILISEQNYLHDQDPFVNEMSCPIIVFYREPDWQHACEKAIHLLQEKNDGHTLAIHSKEPMIVNEFALKKPVARMVVNAAASFSSMGLGSTLPLSPILGGFTRGLGISAENITPANLTYTREIGYASSECLEEKTIESNVHDTQVKTQLIEKVLKKMLEK